MRTEEIASKTVVERGSLDRHMQRLEEENVEMQRQIQQLQAQLAEAEQQHAQRSARGLFCKASKQNLQSCYTCILQTTAVFTCGFVSPVF